MLKFGEDLLHYFWAFVDKWLFLVGLIMLVGDLLEKKFPAIKAEDAPPLVES